MKNEFVFWDFGGKKEYHLYHQLFLSSGALYVLVVDLHKFSSTISRRVVTKKMVLMVIIILTKLIDGWIHYHSIYLKIARVIVMIVIMVVLGLVVVM